MSGRGFLAFIVALAGCWSSSSPTAPPSPSPPPEHVKLVPTCSEAGIGMERGTQDLRAPDHEIARSMTAQCLAGPWSNEATACFAKMKTDELGNCVALLSEAQRGEVFDELKGTDRASVAIALLKLDRLTLGVPECDRFVATVIRVLGCEAMPVDTRVNLGVEASDLLPLPAKAPASARQRMGTVCQASLDTLKREAATIGCL